MSERARVCRCCWRTQVPTRLLCSECYNLTRDISHSLQALYRKFPQYRSLSLKELIDKMVTHYVGVPPK